MYSYFSREGWDTKHRKVYFLTARTHRALSFSMFHRVYLKLLLTSHKHPLPLFVFPFHHFFREFFAHAAW